MSPRNRKWIATGFWLVERTASYVSLGLAMYALWQRDWPQATTWLLLHAIVEHDRETRL